MSDSDEYDKCSDFEFDEEQKLKKTDEEGKNEEAVEEDPSESNDSYAYDNSSIQDDDASSLDSNESDDSPKQSTNQKMKNLTIHDPIKATIEEMLVIIETNETPVLNCNNKTVKKSIKNEYLRFLEEDRNYELDTKLHEHITKLCSEAQKIASFEYKKCADAFGAKNFSTFFSHGSSASNNSLTTAVATVDAKKMTNLSDKNSVISFCQKDEIEAVYHKMFLQEQKYVNLQIEFAEATDSDERKEIDEKCKEAEKEWKKSKNEYDFIKALSAEKMDASISSTNKITDFKAMDSMQEYKNVESSDTESNEKAEFQLKLQKAKATMQSYAQNFSSLKLQMYQQNDKNIKAKYSKFVIQAEIRWKKSRKEYAILCKEANKFDSINPTVTEYQSLKSRLHEVKKQIQDSKKGIQADSVASNNEDTTKVRFDDKNEDKILSVALETMKNYESHFNELQKQLQKVHENSTDEFKEYFLQLFQEAEKRLKKSRDDYEHLNRKCANSLPSTATKLLQHPFYESKDEPYTNCQSCNYRGNDYQKFDGDRSGTLKYLELDPQDNEETTVKANLRGKREAFKSKEIVTKRFKDDTYTF